jgi:Fe-S-cluster-containing dehydrogenase component
LKTTNCVIKREGLTRRDFLTKIGGVAAVTAGASCHVATAAFAEEPTTTAAAASTGEDTRVFTGTVELAIGRVVHNPALCSGCRTCEIVCTANKEGVGSSELSRMFWTKDIMNACITNIMTCKQCAGAECVVSCPTKSLHVDATTGARVIDADLCVGCQLCIYACPVEPPRIRYDAAKNVCFKCDLCSGDPQCVKFCPTGALTASWVEVEEKVEEIDIFEINVTGDAKPFTHILDTSLSEDANGLHATGVVLTSHASQFNIILVNFTVTADFYDTSGNLLGTSPAPAAIGIPEMASQGFDLVYPTSNRAVDIGKVVINCEGICVTNSPTVG